jgi:hypothetical protein
MKRDVAWPKLGITYDDGNTGAAWAWLFWWCRQKETPKTFHGLPHRHMSDIQHRKFYERRRHTVAYELQLEFLLLPWNN